MDTLEYADATPAKQRLRSFSRSPSLKKVSLLSYSPIKLAEAGFQCPENAVSDEVFCKLCGLTFSNWQGESPLAVHRTLRPNCSFLNPTESSTNEETNPTNRMQPSHSFYTSNFKQIIQLNNASSARRQLFSHDESYLDNDNNLLAQPFRPKHKLGFLMLFESHRLLTFLNPFSSEAAIYAKCGFVFNSDSSHAMCVFCNLELELIVGNKEFDVEMLHEIKSPSCPFISGSDVGNISRESERAIRDKVRNNNFCCSLNLSGSSIESFGRNNFRIKHPEYEEMDIRIGTFKSWPMLQRDEFSERKMAECGFYYTGLMDSVRCFCCGVGLRNWSKGTDPFIQHCKTSQFCLFMLQAKGPDFIKSTISAELIVEADYSEMTEPSHDVEQDANSTSTSTCSSPSSSQVGSPTLDMAAIKAATCQYTIEQIADAVIKFFVSSWGQYPNEELLLGTLKAADENHKQICQQREEIINKESEIQAKDSVIQAKDSVIQATKTQLQAKDSVIQAKDSQLQAKDSQLQAKDRELAHTRESLQHQVREELEQIIEEKEELLEQKDELLEQNREMLQQKDEMLDHKDIQLLLKNRELDDLRRHIMSLQQELRRKEITSLGQENVAVPLILDMTDNGRNEEKLEFPVARCTVCLSNPSQIVFQPCGHLCCCDQCASRLYGKQCPICRETNVGLDKVYVT